MFTPSAIFGIAGGALTSLVSAIQQLQNTPILYLGQKSSTPAPRSIILWNSDYEVSAQSAISTQTLVSIDSSDINNPVTSKQYITDNVAPGPRTWQLSCFIKSDDPLSATFTPVALLGLDTSTRKQRDDIWTFFYTRGLATFVDKDGAQWDYVAIEDIKFPADPLNQNTIPMIITLKQVNVLQITSTGLQSTAIPPGSANMGAAANTPISLGLLGPVIGS